MFIMVTFSGIIDVRNQNSFDLHEFYWVSVKNKSKQKFRWNGTYHLFLLYTNQIMCDTADECECTNNCGLNNPSFDEHQRTFHRLTNSRISIWSNWYHLRILYAWTEKNQKRNCAAAGPTCKHQLNLCYNNRLVSTIRLKRSLFGFIIKKFIHTLT